MARAKSTPAAARSSATIGFEAKLSRILTALRDMLLPKLLSGEAEILPFN